MSGGTACRCGGAVVPSEIGSGKAREEATDFALARGGDFTDGKPIRKSGKAYWILNIPPPILPFTLQLSAFPYFPIREIGEIRSFPCPLFLPLLFPEFLINFDRRVCVRKVT